MYGVRHTPSAVLSIPITWMMQSGWSPDGLKPEFCLFLAVRMARRGVHIYSAECIRHRGALHYCMRVFKSWSGSSESGMMEEKERKKE